MAQRILTQPSRTLAEYRLLPGLTTTECTIDRVDLTTPLTCPQMGEPMKLALPIVAAAMQSVSGVRMGIELARLGGVAFIYCSQPIEDQARMVRSIKTHRAGFVEPETVAPDATIGSLDERSRQSGHHTYPVVDAEGVFLGLLTRRDYDPRQHDHLPVSERMIARDELTIGRNVTHLEQAHALLVESRQSVLPLIDQDNRLQHLVFRKDIQTHLDNAQQRAHSVAAINTRDYERRVPPLVDAGVDAVAIDASDGHSFYQQKTLQWLAETYPNLPVIAGNIITREGFRYLAESGAWAIKVGMGGGSICITQEQKGTGRGQATAVSEVAQARDDTFRETGKYLPLIADGGIGTAQEIIIALALGADYVMMGRFFARMEESPTPKVVVNDRVMKPYWGEGSTRAREWKAARYHQAKFTEGVEGFVEYAGHLAEHIEEMTAKIRASMSSCGVANLQQLREQTLLEPVSPLSRLEGQVHHLSMSREAPHEWED